ncbi:transposase [Janibacter cremeus]|uniref:Transposase n=1 Tax=Janibacter cremeus TaxID=1285192 RepID=A0A852VTP8_9MICO|nr:transposase [Janibacter cremeus]NYF97585.1 transposase [Janibacter cremeus]
MDLMVRDGVISNELWDVVEPVLPTNVGRRGRPWNDHRTTLEGIIWRFRTGSPWRDLPAEFGPYQSVWQRHRLWSIDGTYEAMVAAVHEHAGLGHEDLEAILSIDSTSVRAHQHAAGARHDSVVTDAQEDTGGSFELHEFSDRARGAA